jgi:hypothetical protein
MSYLLIRKLKTMTSVVPGLLISLFHTFVLLVLII